MHWRFPLTMAITMVLTSCVGPGCRNFSDGTNSFCIPSAQVLGSVLGLPASDAETGFFIGNNLSDPNRLIVTLSPQDVLIANNVAAIKVGQAPTCRPLGSNPAISRCFTEGDFGASVYSVIFYSNRPGGAKLARADVEEALASWRIP